MLERLKSLVLGTVLEAPAVWAKDSISAFRAKRNPSLKHIFQEQELAALVMKRCIFDGMNCIDVGAHLGSMMSQMVRLSPTGSHTCIEPISYKARWLRKKFQHVECHQVALSDKDAWEPFFVHAGQTGLSGLARNDSSPHEVIGVQTMRLDDLIPPERKIGFLKIDVEGAELQVLKGAKRILADDRATVLFECTKSGLKLFECTPDAVFNFFRRIRYDIFFLDCYLSTGAALDAETFSRSMEFPFRAFNYVAAPRPSCTLDRRPAWVLQL